MRVRPGNPLEMSLILPATLEAIEPVFIAFRECCRRVLTAADGFAGELLLRETLTNAVVHGCRCDAARQVHCTLRLNSRRLLIGVADDGEGFDRHSIRRREEQADNGRGLDILRTYATRVRFNAKGNVTIIVKRFVFGARKKVAPAPGPDVATGDTTVEAEQD